MPHKKKSKRRKTNDYIALIEHLYFVEGLEELRMVGWLKRKYAVEWSKTKGNKLCQIFFSLIMGTDPKKILKELSNYN